MRRPPFRTHSLSVSILTRNQHTFTPATVTSPSPPPPEASRYYISLLHRCAAERSIVAAREVHLHMRQSGFPHLSLGNKLIGAYVKCGAVDDARQVLDEMLQPHIVSWNSVISSYIRSHRRREAVGLFGRMLGKGVVPDEFTFSSIFGAFSSLGLAAEGRGAHGLMVVLGLHAENAFTSSALVDMYAKFGKLHEARFVYDGVDDKDVVLATAMIVGYTQNGEDKEAIMLFRDVIKAGIRANGFTFASVLIACGNLRELSVGLLIHCLICKCGFDVRVDSQTSLLSMYSKCDLINESMQVFDHISNPNTVAWTAIIGCLVCNHREELALLKFRGMLRVSVDANEFTFSTALRGCSSLPLFVLGKMIHARAVKTGLDRHRFVGAALIDMYGKCGHTGIARLVFNDLPGLDLVSVNSMIYGYAQNGLEHEAVKLFDLMLSSGLEPNDVTFVNVLSACSNAGMLDEGERIFSLIKDSRFGPSNGHYACVVDLLGRAGQLKEAEELINGISNPDKVLWRSLLGACKIHGDLERAILAAKKVREIDPGDDGTLVLLSNIYASLGQWNEVGRMKSAMRDMKLKKDPAMSWVEVNRQTHIFMAGDWSHPESAEIRNELDGLIKKTKELGYVPNVKFVLQELDELEKERSLYYHSEKLAMSFAIMRNTNANEPIMIFKNLRVCGDCHTWIKLVSKVANRAIIVRDAKRFHHFQDGLCSCRNYW